MLRYVKGLSGGALSDPQPYLFCLWNGPLSLISVPVKPRPPSRAAQARRAGPEESLSNALYLLGLRGAPIDMMGASNKLRGNLGCGSERAPPDRPINMGFLSLRWGNGRQDVIRMVSDWRGSSGIRPTRWAEDTFSCCCTPCRRERDSLCCFSHHG
jgi:hypothetical protein